MSKAATSFTITPTPQPATYGQTITLTAATFPNGRLRFGGVRHRQHPALHRRPDAAAALGTRAAPQSTGQSPACTEPAVLNAGSYPVTGTYSGDSNYAGSTATSSFTIGQASTSFTFSQSPSPATYGQSVTLSTSAFPAGGGGVLAASGTVTFKNGGTTLCSFTLPTATPSCSAGIHAAGTSNVTATYSGDSNYAGSTANGTVTVGQASTSFTFSSTPSPATYGQSVTLTTSAFPAGGGGVLAAGGTVTFKNGGTTLCSFTLPTATPSCSAGLLARHLQRDRHLLRRQQLRRLDGQRQLSRSTRPSRRSPRADTEPGHLRRHRPVRRLRAAGRRRGRQCGERLVRLHRQRRHALHRPGPPHR